MYKGAHEDKNPLDVFARALKGSAIAALGGILLIIILLLVCAVILNAAVSDPDSFIFFFLLTAVSIGSLVMGYAAVLLSKTGLSASVLSAFMITILTSTLALLFGGPLSFGKHLIMIICVCLFACVGGFMKSRGSGTKRHRFKPPKAGKRPLKR